MRTLLSIASCAGLVMLLTGCGTQDATTGIVQRETMWSTINPDKVGGIDEAVITQVTLEDHDKFFAIWSDLGHSTTFDQYGATDEFIYQGGHQDKDGRKVHFSVAKNSPGSVSVAGTAFDVSSSTLILVATTGSETKTLQLKVDEKEPVPGSRAGLVLYAKSRPEIMSFFDPESRLSAPESSASQE